MITLHRNLSYARVSRTPDGNLICFSFFIASVSVTIILIGPLEHYLHRIGDKPFSEPDSLTHISGTEGRWVERCLAYTNVISAKAVNKHDDVIKWKHFPRYWPFVWGIHRSPVNSPHKGQWRGALMFTLICTRINGWVNNREAGDLRRNRALYDVIVMIPLADCWLRIRTAAFIPEIEF